MSDRLSGEEITALQEWFCVGALPRQFPEIAERTSAALEQLRRALRSPGRAGRELPEGHTKPEDAVTMLTLAREAIERHPEVWISDDLTTAHAHVKVLEEDLPLLLALTPSPSVPAGWRDDLQRIRDLAMAMAGKYHDDLRCLDITVRADAMLASAPASPGGGSDGGCHQPGPLPPDWALVIEQLSADQFFTLGSEGPTKKTVTFHYNGDDAELRSWALYKALVDARAATRASA